MNAPTADVHQLFMRMTMPRAHSSLLHKVAAPASTYRYMRAPAATDPSLVKKPASLPSQ
jgi:hypothetical protein